VVYKKRVFGNGLRLLTVPSKDTQAVTILVMTTVGPRNETKDIAGISHFLEHMLLKGTAKRVTPLKISEAIDEVGGYCNAFTSNEYTGYYVKVDTTHIDLAIDWISDIYLNSRLGEKEIEKEKGVIVEEINMYLDNPMSYKYDLWNNLLYGNQPAGWNILGEKEVIKKFTQKDLLNYYKKYNSKNTIISVAGSFGPDIEDKISKAFDSISVGDISKNKKTEQNQKKPEQLILNKKTDQAHLLLGVRGCDIFNNEKYTQKIITNILGENMSSRIWVEIIEKKGMAYYISTYSDFGSDTGSLCTTVGADIKNIEEVSQIILAEYNDLKKNKISAKELQKAKDCIKGRMSLGLESSSSLANFYTRQELFLNEIKTVQQTKEAIDKVTIEDVYNVANKIFVDEKLNLVLIGDRKEKLKNFKF